MYVFTNEGLANDAFRRQVGQRKMSNAPFGPKVLKVKGDQCTLGDAVGDGRFVHSTKLVLNPTVAAVSEEVALGFDAVEHGSF
jgi:hypothetical protein